MRPRPFWTPARVAGGLALLALAAVLGLAWVSFAAWKAESGEWHAAERADAINRERLALWRLDSAMLAPLGIENNRAFSQYSALAAPAAVVLDETGLPKSDSGRVPSPLLSADLPSWMLLHFELDAEQGWRSPQVLHAPLMNTLAAEPLALPMGNCTAERRERLKDLRRRFPVSQLARELGEWAKSDSDRPAVVVAVPWADEPAFEKHPPFSTESEGAPQGSSSDGGAARPYGYSYSQANRFPVVELIETKTDTKPEWRASESRPLPTSDPSAEAIPVPVETGRNPIEPQLSAEAKARKTAADQVFASRGGYEAPGNGTRNPGPLVPREETLKAKAPETIRPTARFKPERGANDTDPKSSGAFAATNAWAEKLAKSIQDRSKSESDPPSKTRGEKSNDTVRAKGLFPRDGRIAMAKSSTDSDPVGLSKSPPVIAPMAVRLGAMQARRLIDSEGREWFFLLRSAQIADRTVFQGVLVDWPALQETLESQVEDLFPSAKLRPVTPAENGPGESTMTTLPMLLDTGKAPTPDRPTWTPLRIGLLFAWLATLCGIAALVLGGRAIVAMSERRLRFASAVSHELRTPLTALQLHLDLLTSGLIVDEAKKAEYLATMASEADRLNRLVENVLDFAKLEKNSARQSARNAPVAQLLGAVDATWQNRLTGEGFAWSVRSELEGTESVLVDPRVIEQVLGNLIDNARKYSKSAEVRWIRLTAKVASEGRIAFEVEDRGPGVPISERNRIFQPFIRGVASIDTGGAGLGLALAKQWAEFFGGSLTYEPAEPGARFRLELPS